VANPSNLPDEPGTAAVPGAHPSPPRAPAQFPGLAQRQLFIAGFFVVLLVLLYQIAVVFRPFLMPFLWAIILAHVTFPLHQRLSSALGHREGLSAGILTLAIIALVIVPLVLLIIQLIEEAGGVYVAAKEWIEAGGLKRLPVDLSTLPLIGAYIQPILGRLVVSQGDLGAALLQNVKALSGFFVGQLAGFATNVFLLIMNFLVMVFTLFFLFKDGERLYRNLYEVVPLDEAHKRKIFERLDVTLKAVVKGVIITAVVQGLLAGAAYVALGVPFPVVLMAITTLLAPLPFGGTTLVWLPVAGYLYWTGSTVKAIIMLAWGAGVVTMVDNILRPLLIGAGAQLPVLFLFFSIVGGLAAYGMIGIFLGPILLAILITAIQIYREEYLSRKPPPAAQP
jgi:predicted PurR-regulated permease PerM